MMLSLYFSICDQKFSGTFELQPPTHREERNFSRPVTAAQNNIENHWQLTHYFYPPHFFRIQHKPAKFRLQRRTTSRLHAPSQCQRITRCWYHKVLRSLAIVRRRDFYPSTDRTAFTSRRASADPRLCSLRHRLDASHRKIRSHHCIKHIYRACHHTNRQRFPSRSAHV